MTGTPYDLTQLNKASRTKNAAEIRSRCQSVYLGNDVILCRLLGKYKFYVSATDVSFGGQVVMDGFWEMGVTEFVARTVKPGMNVIDVGANFGYYTLLLADLVGPKGAIVAIEPNPTALDCLRKSVSLNGYTSRVKIDERAIWSETDKSLTFRIPDHEAKNARIIPSGTSAGRRPGCDLTVATLALDDLSIDNVGFVKIDVEGAEERVWNGMQRLVERCPDGIYLIEFNCARSETPRSTLESMVRFAPLRYIARGGESTIVNTSVDEVLASPRIDWLLVLSRNQVA